MGSSRLFIWFLSLLITTVHLPALAFTVSSDEQYYVYDDNSYRFIYSEDYRPFIKALSERNANLKPFYEKEFSWKLDEKPYLILASPRNQIANGFATVLPTLHTVFYGGGPEVVDDFSANSWLNALLIHETAHLYQTNAKQSYSKFLHRTLGNPLPNIVPPFTYMTAPNIFLPTFILEGNATFNEARFGNGGRLYNGENRALFLSLLKAGKVNSKRLMNEHIEWPYGREKYVVGAYLQLYLGQKYGVDKTNAFFLKNARRFINPFQLRKSFLDTFGVGYEDVIRDLNLEFKSYAATIKSTDESVAPIAKSITLAGFYRDGSRVFFMTTDGRQMPYLHEISKPAGELKAKKKKHNLPFGKPLLYDGKIYVASGEQVAATAIRYSLFTDGYKRLEKFDNKYVFDTSDNQALYADVPKSFDKVHLSHDTKFLGGVDSSGSFGQDGKTLYFKQAGNQRTLYRDGFALVTYKGYYGKVADTADNGDVFLIAASEKGSTLYRIHDRVITRVLSSDKIVEAALVNDKEVLVAEVTDNGYEYKIVPFDTATNEQPYYYDYFFEKEPAFQFLSGETKIPAIAPDRLPETPAAEAAAKSEEERKPNQVQQTSETRYSTLRYTKFDGLDPFFAGVTLAGDVIAGVAARFSDPMQFHSLNFGYAHLEGGTNDALLLYLNRYHRLNWALGAIFDQSVILENEGEEDESVKARYQSYEAVFQLGYPIYRHPQHGADLNIRYTYEYEESDDKGIPLDREQKVLSYIEFGRDRSYPIAYESNASDRFLIAHEAVGDIPKWKGDRNHYAALLSVSRDLFKQSYFTAKYHAVRSDSPTPDLEIDHTSVTGISLGLEEPTELSRYSSESGIEYREAHQANFKFKQAVDLSVYFTKFPLSLRRLAPFAEYSEYYGRRDRDGSLNNLFHEWVGGAEFEFLFLHKFPFRITAAGVESSARKGTDFTAFVSAAQPF